MEVKHHIATGQSHWFTLYVWIGHLLCEGTVLGAGVYAAPAHRDPRAGGEETWDPYHREPRGGSWHQCLVSGNRDLSRYCNMKETQNRKLGT